MAITREDFPLPDITDELVSGYYAGAAASEVRVPKCSTCDRWCWYPEVTCPACGGGLVWTATSGRATLFSWAVVWRAFLPAFADIVPFVTALVALEEDPQVRLVTMIIDVSPDALVAEMPLEAVFHPLRFPTVPNREVIVPMFRPVAMSRRA